MNLFIHFFRLKVLSANSRFISSPIKPLCQEVRINAVKLSPLTQKNNSAYSCFGTVIVYKIVSQHNRSLIWKKSTILQFILNKINSNEFKSKSRLSSKSFTRDRKLTFSKIIVLMTQKSVKSLVWLTKLYCYRCHNNKQ
jgi:hypothetical protein